MKRIIDRLRLRLDRRYFLLELMPKSSICAEIGVHTGRFSEKILSVVRPRELHLIDPWKHETSGQFEDALYGGKADAGQQEMDARYRSVRERFAEGIRNGQVKVHRGYSSDVLTTFPDGYFDWVYIDGNHLYEGVMQDLTLALAKTKPGGYVTGDDYGREGWWEGGVERAVDEFCRAHPVDLVTIRNHQFVLRTHARRSTAA